MSTQERIKEDFGRGFNGDALNCFRNERYSSFAKFLPWGTLLSIKKLSFLMPSTSTIAKHPAVKTIPENKNCPNFNKGVLQGCRFRHFQGSVWYCVRCGKATESN